MSEPREEIFTFSGGTGADHIKELSEVAGTVLAPPSDELPVEPVVLPEAATEEIAESDEAGKSEEAPDEPEK